MKKILLFLALTTVVFAQQTITDLTVKDLKVVSTIKGSKPCPLMTEVQRDALVSPIAGQCVFNTTSTKLNVHNGTIWKSAGGGIDSWVTGFSYAINDLVIESSKIYICLTAHISGTFAADLVAVKWSEVSQGPLTTSDLPDSLNKRYVTDANLTLIGLTSGTNTGDNSVNSLYSGLATSKQDTLISATNIKTINSSSILGSGDLVIATANLTGDVNSIGSATTYNNTVPLNKGGTGQTTKAPAFDALSPMTTSGDIIIGGASGTGTRLAIGSETKVLKVVSGTPAYAEEDRKNFLVNPSFEDSTLTGWTCTTGTCATTNTAGQFTDWLRGYKVTPNANAYDFYQQVSVIGIPQKVVGLDYIIPATCSGASVKIYADTVLQSTVTTSNKLIADGLPHTLEIPTMASSTIKINPVADTTCTGDSYFDNFYVKSGLGTQALQLDNVYSAQVTTTSGAVSLENKDFIASCTAANPTVCTFNAGIFTVAPNCVMSSDNTLAGSGLANYTAATTTATTFSVYTTNGGGTPVANQVTKVICQKSGNDYLASSAAVYSQASANYSRRAYTPTFTGFGTVSSVDCNESRSGEFNDIDCSFVVGTPTATELRVSLPNSNISSSMGTIRTAGSAAMSNPSNPAIYLFPLIEPSVGYITFGAKQTTDNPLSKIIGTNGYTPSGYTITFKVRIPISGWSNSTSIIGSFAGYTNVPGYQGNVDTFSVSYGTTNATTNCTASPCSYLDQIGTGVSASGVTRSGAGTYSIALSKNYSKLKCSYALNSSGAYVMTNMVTTCSNCASQAFVTYDQTASLKDSFGTIFCQGAY